MRVCRKDTSVLIRPYMFSLKLLTGERCTDAQIGKHHSAVKEDSPNFLSPGTHMEIYEGSTKYPYGRRKISNVQNPHSQATDKTHIKTNEIRRKKQAISKSPKHCLKRWGREYAGSLGRHKEGVCECHNVQKQRRKQIP